MRSFSCLWLILILTACTALGQATGEGAGPPQTSAQLLDQSALEPAFAAGVLLSARNEKARRYEIRLVDPTTGRTVTGYPPLALGPEMPFVQSLSRDGTALAVIETRGWLPEPYAGGNRSWPRATQLHVIDLETWREITVELPGTGWSEPLAFDPEGTHLALVQHQPKSSTLMVYDTTAGELMAERNLDFRPSLVDYTQDGKTLVLYGQPLGSPPGMGEPEPPRVVLAEAATLDIRWDQPLANIASGDWCLERCSRPHGAQVFTEWRPAVIPSPDGQRLNIVQADKAGLTKVDLETQTMQSVELQAMRPWFEQLLALTAGVAEAKGGLNGATKTGVLSPDGEHLYVAGQTMTTILDAEGNWERMETELDLQLIEVENGRKMMSRDLEVSGTRISADRMQLTPDGRHLVVSGWQDGGMWTEVFDPHSLEPVTRLDGWQIILTRQMDGQPVILAQQWRSERHTNLAILDPDSFDIVHSWAETSASWVAPLGPGR